MNLNEKRALAQALLQAAGNLVEMYQDNSGYYPEIEHLDSEEVKAQLGLWLKSLPGYGWDTRLGKPQ